MHRYGNINPLSISYVFRPHLRSRLTLSGLTFLRNPWVFGEQVSHLFNRYSCQQSLFRHVQKASRLSFSLDRMLSYRSKKSEDFYDPAASVLCLAPLNFPRRSARPVSCYAFFKGWLLLSQPPGCFSRSTSFST
jgi:hypothetical protein